MNKIKKETRNFYIFSFILPFAATMLLFIISGIFPFGDKTFLRKDFYQQYTPFFYEFYNKMKNGESLFYSWKAGIGANFLAVYVYYLASPLNFLSLLFPEKYILEFMSYMVVIKTGLMGMTFSHYLRRRFDRTDYAISLFGMAYAFSGFMAAYNWNVMWMDVLVLTPLVILGLEYVQAGKKPYLYCITLALSIYTNYYLSIMLCIYLVIDFIALSVKNGFRLSGFIRFGWYSLIAGAVGAVLMLPELAALQFTSFTSSKFPTERIFYMKIPEIFGRHLIGVTTETGLDHWPNIYCGLFTVFLLSLYFATRRIALKEKIVNICVILFFLLSYNLNQLNYIWHGMNYPDSLPARQSYLYIVLLLTIAYEGFLHLRDSGKIAYYTSMVIAVAGIFAVLLLDHDDALSKDTFIFNISFAIAWFAFFMIYREVKRTSKDFGYSFVVILFFMAVELTANQFYTNGHSISRTDYFKSFASYRELNENVEKLNKASDNPLGRVDEIKRKIRNNSMMIGFSSLSCFSSTNNGLIKKYCDRYGLENSRVFYLNEGVTALSAAIMGQHYTLVPANASWSADDIADKISTSAGSELYALKYTLPAGYVLHTDSPLLFDSIEDCDDIIKGEKTGFGYGSNPLNIENDLLDELGIKSQAFDLIEHIELENAKTADLTYESDCHLYLYDSTKTKSDMKVAFSDGSSELTYASRKYKYVLDLGYHKKGTKVKFKSTGDGGKIDFRIYKLNTEAMDEFTNMINSSERVENIVRTDNKLTGDIDLSADGHLVFQIPYEKGWTLKVDGIEKEIETFDSLYISTPLEAGHHRIELSFYPEGFNEGLIISLLAVLLIAISFFMESRTGVKILRAMSPISQPFDEAEELKALERLEKEKAREREREREREEEEREKGREKGDDKDKKKEDDENGIPGGLVGV
ncbi:YfhO family protein [Lachnospiraceae bacterium C1.1]|nr:YfhO family protein [Lachnospiraceae bacterium C1.1]